MNYLRNVAYSSTALIVFSLVGCNLSKTPKDQTSIAAKLTATSEVPANTSKGQGTLKGEVILKLAYSLGLSTTLI